MRLATILFAACLFVGQTIAAPAPPAGNAAALPVTLNAIAEPPSRPDDNPRANRGDVISAFNKALSDRNLTRSDLPSRTGDREQDMATMRKWLDDHGIDESELRQSRSSNDQQATVLDDNPGRRGPGGRRPEDRRKGKGKNDTSAGEESRKDRGRGRGGRSQQVEDTPAVQSPVA